MQLGAQSARAAHQGMHLAAVSSDFSVKSIGICLLGKSINKFGIITGLCRHSQQQHTAPVRTSYSEAAGYQYVC